MRYILRVVALLEACDVTNNNYFIYTSNQALIFFTFIYNRSSKMNYFIYTSHHFTPHGRYEPHPMCGFIARLVEQRTGNAEVTGSNPVEAMIFFSHFFLLIA